jgi:molybdopterin/thiamine biosynthesis adenylyltransferase
MPEARQPGKHQWPTSFKSARAAAGWLFSISSRDPAIDRITLIEPDIYAAHNVQRHLFPPAAVGQLKAELAAEWLRARRPDLRVETVIADITDAAGGWHSHTLGRC